MSSTQDLFGDDDSSSSDDDDNINNDRNDQKPNQPAAGVKTNNNNNLSTPTTADKSGLGDEDSDDSKTKKNGVDDDKKEKESLSPTPKRVKMDVDDDENDHLKDSSDSSDDEEGDVEFDDSNIVGESAPKGLKRPQPSVPPSSRPRGLSDDADDDHDQDAMRTKKKQNEDEEKIAVNIEKWSIPEPPESSPLMVITKLPNLLGIQTLPFDPNTYDAEEEEEMHEKPNLVRWRYKNLDDYTAGYESNARLVQWEDNTWTLHIGNDKVYESFEIDTLETKTNDGFAG